MVLLPSPSERKHLRHLRKKWGVASTGQVAPQGTVEQWEHWDGSVDAVVKVAPIHLRLRRDKDLTPLIADLEAAVRHHQLTLLSGTPEEQREAAVKVEEAKTRLEG